MKNKLNKKIFIVLVLFSILLSFISFNNKVFASTEDITYVDVDIDWDGWTLVQFPSYMKDDSYYRIYGHADTPNGRSAPYVVFIDKAYYDKHNVKTYLTYENGKYYINFTQSVPTAESWNGCNYLYVGLDNRLRNTCGFVTSQTDSNGNACLDFRSTLPLIYRDNNFNTTFFQSTPQTLAQVMELEGIKKTIPTTLVGLVKLLIPLLVCLLGLWKGWHLVLRILQKA